MRGPGSPFKSHIRLRDGRWEVYPADEKGPYPGVYTMWPSLRAAFKRAEFEHRTAGFQAWWKP